MAKKIFEIGITACLIAVVVFGSLTVLGYEGAKCELEPTPTPTLIPTPPPTPPPDPDEVDLAKLLSEMSEEEWADYFAHLESIEAEEISMEEAPLPLPPEVIHIVPTEEPVKVKESASPDHDWAGYEGRPKDGFIVYDLRYTYIYKRSSYCGQ